jgi:hypothetical protein
VTTGAISPKSIQVGGGGGGGGGGGDGGGIETLCKNESSLHPVSEQTSTMTAEDNKHVRDRDIIMTTPAVLVSALV